MRSKAIRRSVTNIKELGLLFWLKDHTIWPIESFFSRVYERLSRSWAYAKFGYMHYDFDSAYLFDIMAFKLRRIEDALINGHAIHEEADLAALKEAIEICNRLHEEKYEQKYHEEHDLKWGDLDMSTGSDGFIVFSRSNVTPETEDQERAESLSNYTKAEKDRTADLERLFVILTKHHRTWWD